MKIEQKYFPGVHVNFLDVRHEESANSSQSTNIFLFCPPPISCKCGLSLVLQILGPCRNIGFQSGCGCLFFPAFSLSFFFAFSLVLADMCCGARCCGLLMPYAVCLGFTPSTFAASALCNIQPLIGDAHLKATCQCACLVSVCCRIGMLYK